MLAAAAAIAPWPAAAEWLRATTPHFIVYSNTSEQALRRQAEDLELFDAMIRLFQALPDTENTAYNKVTVFVVPSISAVARLSERKDIAGFYIPRATGSIAFTPRVGAGEGTFSITPQIVLFHEYAHHLLLGNYAAAYPAWFSEGYAEFASTTKITPDTVTMGTAAVHRGYGLLTGRGLSAAALFLPPARMSDEQREAIYGRGWLLTHYIVFDKDRRAQFLAYLQLLNGGTPSLTAAQQAFGDLKQLDRDLDKYLMRSRLPALITKRSAFKPAAITVAALTPGQSALIDSRMVSARGVDSAAARTLFAKAKLLAAAYPSDPVAQGWLAEMAYDAEDDAAAEAAADAALATDATSSQALLYKARVHLRRAAGSDDPKTWREARSWILKANRANTNDAAALLLFYQSFDMEKAPPPPSAIAGLYRAAQLVPQDTSVRFLAARQMIVDGDVDGARAALRPLAYDAHARPDNIGARLLAALDAGKRGPAALAAARSTEKAD